MHLRRTATLSAVLLLAAIRVPQADAQKIGDQVRLNATNPQGVPVHPAAGDQAYVRWANGTLGSIISVDPATGWFQIESGMRRGWVVARYLAVIEPDEDDIPANEVLSYAIGTWNLEHFSDTSDRGFPEDGSGGPHYGPRTDNDFRRVAQIITTGLDAKILILNEIDGIEGTRRSVELDRLLVHLGQMWAYDLAESGEHQRIAIIYDTKAAKKENCAELSVPKQLIENKDVFARDPLACFFTLLDKSGQAKNDLIIVGVHLASGQHLAKNHNTAMDILRKRLAEAVSDSTFPSGEKDVFIGGDFNASRYDTKKESFWTDYDPAAFRFLTLSPEDPEEYPPTRLAGVPLFPRSQIDYLLASGLAGGLVEKLVQERAQVHAELLANGADEYRKHVSDHIPVTVRVRVAPDVD